MNNKVGIGLVRGNVLAAMVFIGFAVAFFIIAYLAIPSGMPSSEAYRAAQSSQDSAALRTFLQQCLVMEAAHAKALGQMPLQWAVLSAAISLIAALIFGANALSVRKACVASSSNR